MAQDLSPQPPKIVSIRPPISLTRITTNNSSTTTAPPQKLKSHFGYINKTPTSTSQSYNNDNNNMTSPTSPTSPSTPYYNDTPEEKGVTRRLPSREGFMGIIDSFKEMPPTIDGQQTSALSRSLRGRHLQMIAIGGAIGTGLFVSSGSALAEGGPASLVIAFALVGGMLYCTVHALGELAVLYPVAGSFAVYGSRFIDPAWGFAMGWNYALGWLVAIPLEIVSASLTISFWSGGAEINAGAWVALFWVLVVGINLFGARGYGEAEFVFSIVKVIAVIGFIILSIIINVDGAPGGGGYIGGKYWHDPGAFHNGFKGLCSVFVTASFAFAGTELAGLAAAETENPRKTLPPAIKQVFWRILVFYLVSLTLIGLNVPYTNPHLLNGSSSADATASPFVISIRNAGVEILPAVFNVVILISVLSVGNSSIYGSSRTIAALAEQRQAPRVFGYIDRRGRPLVAILFSSAWGLVAFVAAAGPNARNQVLNWLIACSGLSLIFTWGSINACHLRFRRAWKKRGHSTDELAFVSHPGVVGSWIGLGFNVLVLIAQFWTGFAPTGYKFLSSTERTELFFEAYLSAPIVMTMYIGYKLYFKTKFVRLHEIDLVSGRRDLDLDRIFAEERLELRRSSGYAWYYRVWKILC